ncbi:MAG: type II toxin-antitoxin system RelE/ParE family toxin [Thiomicrorhabdus sp.]|nr:type II toxin-antitoxin system RelE/ParE family toxin [Thiomicrorhabdus sp.]
MYTVRFSKKAEKALKNIDPVMKRRVLSKVDDLTKKPRNDPNIKTMKGFKNRYRYRVGDFRVVYELYTHGVWDLGLGMMRSKPPLSSDASSSAY